MQSMSRVDKSDKGVALENITYDRVLKIVSNFKSSLEDTKFTDLMVSL